MQAKRSDRVILAKVKTVTFMSYHFLIFFEKKRAKDNIDLSLVKELVANCIAARGAFIGTAEMV